MRISRGLAIRLSVSFLLLIALFLTAQHVFAAGPHGCEGNNLIPNCNFDGPFTERGRSEWKLPPGWEPFVLSGGLTFRENVDTYWGAPSVEMVSEGTPFDAGVYTQVGGLQPGATYRASVGWFAAGYPADSFCRRLGIDPTGGTDANAPSVVWGPTFCGKASMLNYPPPDTNIDVSAVARNSTVTVFANAKHAYAEGTNYIFLDALELVQDSNAPVAPPPTDTPPPPPPTAQPQVVQVQPTPRPTRTPTPVPTATATPTATSTYTASPTLPPTRTATPLPTETPSITPSSTLPPRPAATAAPPTATNPFAPSPSGNAPTGLLFGGFGALGMAGLLGVALVVTRKK